MLKHILPSGQSLFLVSSFSSFRTKLKEIGRRCLPVAAPAGDIIIEHVCLAFGFSLPVEEPLGIFLWSLISASWAAAKGHVTLAQSYGVAATNPMA